MHVYVESTYMYIVYGKPLNSTGRLLAHITLQFIVGVCSQNCIFTVNEGGTQRVHFW